MIHVKNNMVSDLAACKRAFEMACIPWSITDGVILGYARYKDVMEWDADLDTGVFVELTSGDRFDLWRAMNLNGFNVPNINADFVYCKRLVHFCIGFWHRNGDYYEQFPSTTPGIKFIEKAMWHDEQQIVDFLGDKYPIPSNIEDYLVSRYEKDWLTNIIKNPDQYFEYRRGSLTDQSKWTEGRSGKHGHLWPKILKIEDNVEDLT